MLKVDLHTHSIASPDGGITPETYSSMLRDQTLDYIAVTDHNTISLAQELHTLHGDKIIVGEEIMTTQGEVIGLFLKEVVPSGLSAAETMRTIKKQGGLVYIPHPFETVRSSLNRTALDETIELIDIVEVHDARSWAQNRGPTAVTWATLHHKARAASSDAHGAKGLGHSFTMLQEAPTAINLVSQLVNAQLTPKRASWQSLFYPKYHRTRQTIMKIARRK